MADAREVLEKIAANGAAMSVLSSGQCAVVSPREPKTYPIGAYVDGVHVGGTLELQNGDPVDIGAPAVTLADLIREALA